MYDGYMKEVTIPVSEFKAKCLRLLEDVEAKGDRIVITKRGRPMAQVAPIISPKVRLRGTWEGLVEVKGDIVYFSDDSWESDSE
jgi:prevent-host-death family protein